MTVTDKRFLRDCALYVKGDITELRFRGKPTVVEAFAKTLAASRKFYIAIQEESFPEAISALKQKRAASKVLSEQTGYTWPL